MGRSTIEWTDYTFNPWRGCSKVSIGCEHCYAERYSQRNPAMFGTWGENGLRIVAAEATWNVPRSWNAEARRGGPRRVFCGSLCDVFEDRPELVGARARLVKMIVETPDLIWLLLTKRPENIARLLVEAGVEDYGPGNLWLGATVEDSAALARRWPKLEALRGCCGGLFLSYEPALGPLSLAGPLGYPRGLDWLIAGGETGPGARPPHPGWFRSVRDQCQDAGVPFFFKGWGDWAPCGQFPGLLKPGPVASLDGQEGSNMTRVGKRRARRLLDGREWNATPFTKDQ